MADLGDFLDYLVEQGLLDEAAARGIRGRTKGHELLGQLLLRHGHISMRQLIVLLGRQADEPESKIGELAISEGFVSGAVVEEVLALQPSTRLAPLDVIVREEVLALPDLFEALVSYVKLLDRARCGPELARVS